MRVTERFEAAVAAGVLASEEQFGRLLRSIVEVARAIFGAKASSIFLFDEETDELVFAAVAGDDEQHLVGTRLPSSTGHRGLGALVAHAARARRRPEGPALRPRRRRGHGLRPQGLMAVPLLDDEEVLGVLQVLDRPQRSRFSLQEMELLGLFAGQAAIALALLGSARRARRALAGEGDAASVAELAAALESLEGDRRAAATALLPTSHACSKAETRPFHRTWFVDQVREFVRRTSKARSAGPRRLPSGLLNRRC